MMSSLFRYLFVPAFLFAFAALPVQAQSSRLDAAPSAYQGVSPSSFSSRAAVLDGTDEDWDDRFGFPGVSGIVHAAAVAPNGDVYVGGYISSASGQPVSNIARWDGRRWQSLGEGVDDYVYALAFAENGDLYVGGEFVNAGKLRVNGLAKWSPATSSWSPVSTGVAGEYGDGKVTSLLVDGTNLYLAGAFVKAGGQSITNLAMWDGTTFRALGQGVGRQNWDGTFAPAGTINALAIDGDLIYVGGSFDAVDTGVANGIAAWDKTTQTWTPLGGGFDQGYSYASAGTVVTLAVHNGELYAGGTFKVAGPFGTGIPANNVAKWNGTSWSALGTGLEGVYSTRVNSLAFAGDVLYAAGDFTTAGGREARYIAGWQNGEWFEPDGGFGGVVNKLAASADGALYAGGAWVAEAGENVYISNVGRWDGTSWTSLGQGLGYSSIPATVYALANDGTQVYAGGYQTHAGGVPVSNISSWNGTLWSDLGLGTDGTVHAMAVAANGDVYVGGQFTSADGVSTNHIGVWNPATRTWRGLESGTNGYVYDIAIRGNDVYVGGAFTAAGAVVANRIARWDGTRWHAVGTGVNYDVYTIAAPANGNVYVGGDFSQAGGSPANGIAVWNGANWSALGRGLTGSSGTYAEDVNAIVVDGNDVYVAGEFVTAGTSSAAGVAKWTQATGWSALGLGLGGSSQAGYTLLLDGNILYVGGDFLTAGGKASNNIAAWNTATSTWETLASGVTGEVRALTKMGQTLYLSGSIRTAGGKPASGFAAWNIGQGQQAVAQFSVNTQTLSFGNVTVGQSSDRTITVTNGATATAALQLTVNAPAAPFSIVSGGGTTTVAPGASHNIVVRFSPAAAAAANGTLTLTHNGANAASPSTVTLSGTGTARGGQVVVLRAFDPAAGQLVGFVESVAPIDSGFVFGTNAYGDKAKSVTLDLGAGKSGQNVSVSQVDIYFSYRKSGLGNQSYTLHLYNTDSAGMPTGSPAFSRSYRIADVSADEDPNTVEGATAHVFDPVSVSTPFAVVVDFGSYPATDAANAAIGINNPVQQRVDNVWEQWSDGSWHNLSDAWSGTYSNGVPVEGTGTRGWQPWIEAYTSTSTAADAVMDLPTDFTLGQNYPNPFNPTTAIEFALPRAAQVSVKVYDLTGREVAVVFDGELPAGAHSVNFDARDLATGSYVYRMTSGAFSRARMMTVVK